MKQMSPAAMLLQKIHKTVYVFDRIAEKILVEKTETSFSHFLILLALDRKPSMSQREIASFLDLTPAAVSRQVENLKDKKLITIKQNKANRRENILLLTPHGEKHYDKCLKLLDTHFTTLLKPMPDKMKKELDQALTQILKIIVPLPADTECLLID